jgi:HTH-type transcriptional regulator, sugar sensing transcriptional regulator
MSQPDAIESLAALGFTDIEARVYCFLLAESPATGYRIAQGIGKAAANTYKAIDDLVQRGAVLVDDGETRLVRAVRPRELIAAIEREQTERKRRATSALEAIESTSPDERVYRLTTPKQVLERARAMLKGAKEIALADLFPPVAEILAGDLEKTARSGTRVVAKFYSPIRIPKVELVFSRETQLIFDAWPGAQLSLVTDAREHLFALLSHDLTRVHQAVWSNSVFLSCLAYNHLASEFQAGGISEYARSKPISLLRIKPPGLADLASAYGNASPKEPSK